MGQSVVRSSHDFWGPDSFFFSLFFTFFLGRKIEEDEEEKKSFFLDFPFIGDFFLHLKVSPGMKCEHPTMSVVSQKITFY